MQVQEKLKRVPRSPGVYFFKDKKGTIIYIGKAKVLRNRVRSYFQSTKNKDSKTRLLVRNIADLDWLVVRDEVEAFLTEANLIRTHRPRFNISLKDDKTFPYIKITNEPYPQVFVYRNKNIPRDGSRYFGPYTEVKRLRETMRVIHKVFPLRTCDFYMDETSISEQRHKVCLDYHIKRCDGPCEGLVSRDQYNTMIEQIVQFLRGRNDALVKYLKEKMSQASEQMLFEDAGRYRDQLEAVTAFTNRQKKVASDFSDRDILVVAHESNYGMGVVLRVRNGFYIAREKFDLKIVEDTPESEIISQFLRQYYSSTVDIPGEILLEHVPDQEDQLLEWFRQSHDVAMRIHVPIRGEKKKLVRICRSNADLLLGDIRLRKMKRRELVPKSVTVLQEDLNLEVPPRRIEAFDNSNIQGSYPVASMVCFIDGKPKKGEYRKFDIKTVVGPDDFESMYEVVKRRYTRVLAEKLPLPDLILIDGGKGQLRFAKRALDELKLQYVPIIGLAKRLEEVFRPDVSSPMNIPKTSPGLFLLRHVRDEAHRFAITFHRQKRGKEMTRSSLEEIKGLGKKRVQLLWQRYTSLESMQKSTPAEMHEFTGIPLQICTRIVDFLQEP